MLNYILKRFILTIISIFILLTLLFFLMQLIPGYPVEKGVQETQQEYLERLRNLGLLDNPFVQFGHFWQGLFKNGEFGLKYNSSGSVIDTFMRPMKFTMLIAIPSFIIASILGIILGMISAYNRGRWQDTAVNIFAVIFAAVPSFVMALYLLQLADVLHLPKEFIAPGSQGYTFQKMIESVLIPIISMVLASVSVTVYFTRNELVEIFKQEYIKTALAKGMPFIQVLFKHALRNALIPVLFSLLPNLLNIITGSFIIEAFFNVPGTALVIINAVQTKEIFVVIFSAVFFSSIYYVLQIFFDILSTIIDPRIKLVESSNKSIFKIIRAKYHRFFDDGKNYIINLNKMNSHINFQEKKEIVVEKYNNVESIKIIPNKPIAIFNNKKINFEISKALFQINDITTRIYTDSIAKPSTRWKDIFKRLFKDVSAVIFISIFAIIVLLSIVTPLCYMTNPNNNVVPGIKNLAAYLPPRIPFLGLHGIVTKIMTGTELKAWQDAHVNVHINYQHDGVYNVTFNPFDAVAFKNYYPILGTGPSGEDWNNKLWYATAESLIFAIVVAIVSTFIGGIYGSIAGYNAGKTVDNLMMRFVEILSGVPTIVWILVFALVFSTGTISMPIIGLSLISVTWIWPAITARVFILKHKDADYIAASRTLGASHTRLIFNHLIPNISGKMMVRLVNQIPKIIFFETSIIFLGLKSATDTNLGSMIQIGWSTAHPYLLLPPTFIIVLITLSMQIIANAFNDALDPRVSGGK
ncbi:MAG: ABC transporter permease subunit [Mycoplasmoidaceae bacterium]